jgi:SAM-dependent methyltransferase
MSDASTASFWDERFAGDEFWYGTLPNDFLREHASALPPRGRVLSLGEGEGRNAAFLAAQGLEVVAVDASAVALAKAARLARERGVAITTVHADLERFALGRAGWDGIISIWCHLPLPLRARVHRDIVAALRPGGVFLLEAYTPAQLAFRTGGPSTPDLLVTAVALREELAGLTFEIAAECEREIHEGRRHNGHSAVVQILARRPGASGRPGQNR